MIQRIIATTIHKATPTVVKNSTTSSRSPNRSAARKIIPISA